MQNCAAASTFGHPKLGSYAGVPVTNRSVPLRVWPMSPVLSVGIVV